MLGKNNLVKRFSIEEMGLILFISSRLITWLLSLAFGHAAIYITMGLFLFIYGCVVIKKIKNKDIDYLCIFSIIFLFLTILILISATENQFRRDWLLSRENGIIVKVFDPRKGIFALFLLLMIKDTKKIMKALYYGTGLILAYTLIQVILFLITNSWDNYYIVSDPRSTQLGYNLNLGYEAIFAFVIYFYSYLINNKKINFVLSVLALFIAINFGARGVIIILGAFSFICVIFAGKKLKDRLSILLKFLILIIITAILCFSYIKSIDLIKDHFKITQSTDEDDDEIGSRTIDSLVDGDISNDNGRVKLWKYSIEAIKNSPIIGNGIYGDRLYVGNTFKWGYSHNIFLEMIASFGLFGLVFLLLLIYLVLKCILKKELDEQKGLIIIFGSMCCKLIISDSFLFLDQFWMLFAVIIVSIYERYESKKNLKKLILPICILFILNVILLLNYIRVDAKRVSFNDYKPEQKIAVINFEDAKSNIYDEVFLKLNKEIVATLFVDDAKIGEDNYLNQDQLLGIEKSNWSIEDSFTGDKSWPNYSINEVEYKIARANQNYLKYKLNKPSLISSLTAGKNLKVMPSILKERKAFYNYTSDLDSAIYEKINAEDFYQLKGYRLETKDQILNLISGIDEYLSEDKGLLILDFNTISKTYSENNIITYDDVIYIIEYLKDHGFIFKSLENIVESSYIAAEDRTIWEYIKNFNISYILK